MAATRIHVDSVAKKPDKHIRHILAALDLPEIEEAEPLYAASQEEGDEDLVI